MKKRFNLGLFVRGKGGNHKIAGATVNLGSTKGRGSSTRMFNYCKQTSANPSNCINQFINVVAPTQTQTCDYIFTGTGELTSDIVNNEIGTAQNICIVGYTSIGSNAFNGKTQITSVTIGNTVTSIGNYAFYQCENLESVTIPDSVTSIGSNAFRYSGLTSVTIPDSVISIGNLAFYECANLTSINVDPDNANYSSIEGVLFNEAQTILIQYPVGKSELLYTIPNLVEIIGEGAFYNGTSLESVIIPNSVEIIDGGAFEFCTHLESVTIPNSVISIGNSAFNYCINLSSIIISNSATSIGNSAFYYCTNLSSIIIPNSVISIGNNAFLGSVLTTVTIANGQVISGTTFFSPTTNPPGVPFFGKTVTTITP